MHIKSLMGQLRSDSVVAQNAAIGYLCRQFSLTSMPGEFEDELLRLWAKGPPWTSCLVSAVCSCPSPRFASAFREVLFRGSLTDQELAVEYLNLWRKESDLILELYPKIEEISRSTTHDWLAFLACLQLARVYGEGDVAWQRAAKAVKASDYRLWYQSIRSQAEELLTADEFKKVNKHLENMRARELTYVPRREIPPKKFPK